MLNETPLLFACGSDMLLGILHKPTNATPTLGVVLVVGGPQYRVGSHRQFVLLARTLALADLAVLRFDYRGMGDSSGQPRDFESISDDIRAAIDRLYAECPGLDGVILWGLCDAASANAFYASGDDRVVGQVALNPWVRTEEGAAEAYIRHYYRQRLLSKAFWKKVLALQFDVGGSLRDFIAKLQRSRGGSGAPAAQTRLPLPQRVREAQRRFAGPTLVILSGQDLTAREYEARVGESPEWRSWLGSAGVTVQRLEEADHTFSRAAWRDQVAAWTRDWIQGLRR